MKHKLSRVRSHASTARSVNRDAAKVAQKLEQEFPNITDSGLPMMRWISEGQCRFLVSVYLLADQAYNERIQQSLHARFGEEINIGQISSTAKALATHGLIKPHNGGMPSGKGRPVTVWTVTKLGETVLKQTLAYIHAMKKEITFGRSQKTRKALPQDGSHPTGARSASRPSRLAH
jgi:hypothetical protein